jgi:hypothetical protein
MEVRVAASLQNALGLCSGSIAQLVSRRVQDDEHSNLPLRKPAQSVAAARAGRHFA